MPNDLFSEQGKRCPHCGRILEHWQFNRSRFTRDGLQRYCKECQVEYRRIHPQKEYKRNKKDFSLKIW